jgi:hypothetical protein
MPLPSLRGHEEANASAPHAPESSFQTAPHGSSGRSYPPAASSWARGASGSGGASEEGAGEGHGTLHLHISLDGRTNFKAQEAE